MDTEESKGGGKRRVRTKGLQKKLLQQVRESLLHMLAAMHGAACHCLARYVRAYFLQVEFYFGDSNLQKDRFLQQKMKEHPDGCTFVYLRGCNKDWEVIYNCLCLSFFIICMAVNERPCVWQSTLVFSRGSFLTFLCSHCPRCSWS